MLFAGSRVYYRNSYTKISAKLCQYAQKMDLVSCTVAGHNSTILTPHHSVFKITQKL